MRKLHDIARFLAHSLSEAVICLTGDTPNIPMCRKRHGELTNLLTKLKTELELCSDKVYLVVEKGKPHNIRLFRSEETALTCLDRLGAGYFMDEYFIE